MPGPLSPVEQPFDADITKYIEKVRAMKAEYASLVAYVAANPIKIDADISGAMAKIGEVRSALAGLGDKEITVTVKYVTVGDKPGAGAGLGADHGAMIRELRDISASMDQATSSMGRMEDHMAVMRRDVAGLLR